MIRKNKYDKKFVVGYDARVHSRSYEDTNKKYNRNVRRTNRRSAMPIFTTSTNNRGIGSSGGITSTNNRGNKVFNRNTNSRINGGVKKSVDKNVNRSHNWHAGTNRRVFKGHNVGVKRYGGRNGSINSNTAVNRGANINSNTRFNASAGVNRNRWRGWGRNPGSRAATGWGANTNSRFKKPIRYNQRFLAINRGSKYVQRQPWRRHHQYNKSLGTKQEIALKWAQTSLFGNELKLKQFSILTLKEFFRNFSQDKKLSMFNYWKVFDQVLKPDFSFTYPWSASNDFYMGVSRIYIRTIKGFMRNFLKRLKARLLSGSIKAKFALRGFYGVYRSYVFISYLSKLYEKQLKKPRFYFPGYRSFLRIVFFKHLSIFCMKILTLANRVFMHGSSKVKEAEGFFYLWKKVYKRWLNIYYRKPSSKRKAYRTPLRSFVAFKLFKRSVRWRNNNFWRSLYRFRLERSGYKRVLLDYLYSYGYSNFGTDNPFTYKRRKFRFKTSVTGKRIYLLKKKLFRRKSRKYISWFRTLVTGGYYFSQDHAEKTFYKMGYGKRAWISRRRAKHVFKMKFVFIRYFSKKFGLKNRTAFLRKAEHIARKGGNKWLRYYKEFESRLLRVLVLFGICSNDNMAKSLISNNWVLINKKIFNDHLYNFIPRVKIGDLVGLTAAGSAYILKKKVKFFRKRLAFFDRADEAKLVYSLFKSYFSQWLFPTFYSINGMIIKHGLTSLMSGPVVSNSKEYYSINKLIPFYNRTLFKIFIQRFTKKLN